MRFLIATLSLCLLVPASFARTKTKTKSGSIDGVVSGADAGKLAGVRVYLLRAVPSRDKLQPPLQDSTSDFHGNFGFDGVAPGTYTIRLRLDGWEEKFLDGVEVAAAQKLKLPPVELAPELAKPLVHASLDPAPEPQLQNRSDWWGSKFNDLEIDQLPTSRTVWSLLQGAALSTVTSAGTQTDDTAQLETGTTQLFGAHGASWTENQYLYNGFNATDPYVTGLPLVDPDYAALDTVTDVIGSKPATLAGAGNNLMIALPPPPESLHGQVGLFFSARALQANNMTAPLIDEDFPGPERMNHLFDGNAQVGDTLRAGPIAWPFFVAFSTQNLSKDLGGFGAPIDSHADHILVELTPYRHGNRRLNLLYSGQQEFNNHDGAFPGIATEATRRRNDNFHQFQGRWSDALSATTLWEAGFGVTHAILSRGLDNGPLATSTQDLPLASSPVLLPLLTLTGSAQLAQMGRRTRYEATSMVQTTRNFLGSHALSAGVDLDWTTMSNRWLAFGGMQQITVGGEGAQVIEWSTPATPDRAAVQNYSFFVQDGWRPVRWLRVPMGLRLTATTGKAAGAPNRITWATLEPRIGVVFPTPHLNSLLWHAGYARYAHALQGQYLDYGNPLALGGQTFAWSDANSDGIAQPGEIGGIQKVFGGPYSGIAPGLRRPTTDEITAGFEARIGRYYQIRARGFIRYDHHLINSTDTGVPLSDYTPTVVPDPGILTTTTDPNYTSLVLYNQNPASLGHNFDSLDNPGGLRASAKGMDVEMIFRSGRQWEVHGQFTAMRTQQTTNVSNSVYSNDTGALNLFGNTPNDLVNNAGLSYFDHGKFGKVQVIYNLPRGFQMTGILRYLDGLPYSPLLLVPNFNQGPFFVLAVPRNDYVGFRANFTAEADLRVAKTIALKRGSLHVVADFFNLQNQSKNTIEHDLSDERLHHRSATAIQAPFTTRLGAEWSF